MERTGRSWGYAAVFGLALSSVACGGGGMGMGPGAGGAKQPMGHLTVQKQDAGDDAPDGAKTITVEYKFDKDLLNKDIDKSFDDGFQKKGLDVKENITAHTHFDVKDAKITGTVTYVKKGMGHYSVISADLIAEAHYDADVKVDMDVQVKGDTKNAKDGDWDNTIIGGKPVPIVKNMMPTNIPIAGPLFLHAHFDLSAACDVQVEGSIHAQTGVGIAGDVRLAAHYKKDGIQMPDGKTQKFQFESKAPNFELAPKPFLNVTGGKQRVKGRCSLQPTAVLLLENMVGAKMSVEPYVELDAHRNTPKEKWKLDVSAGVSVNASTEMQFFGRQLRKPKEYTLYEVVLLKPGQSDDAAPTDTRIASREKPSKGSKGSSATANMLDAGLGGSKPSSSSNKLAMNDTPSTNDSTKTASDATSTGTTTAPSTSATTTTASAPIPPSAPSASPSTSSSAVASNTPPQAPIPPSTPPGSTPSTSATTAPAASASTTSTTTAATAPSSSASASPSGIGPSGAPPAAPPEPGSKPAMVADDSDMPPTPKESPKKGAKKKGAVVASRGAAPGVPISKGGSGVPAKVSGLLKKKKL